MSSDLIIHVTDSSFDAEVLKSSEPVLVDFWAPWCQPCLALSPILDKAASQLQGSVKVVKVNVDDYQTYAQQYGVRSIPSLFVFKDGKVVNKHVGGLSDTALVDFVKKSI